MNDKSINSLISAYHDGELSAAERTEVERLLASSPEARAELESCRRVSKLLREAGRPKLKTDLTPLVMQAIQKQPTRSNTSAQPAQKTARMGWTKWAATVAVAAGLMIAVKTAWQPAQAINVAQPNPEKQVPANVPSPEVVAPVEVATTTPVNKTPVNATPNAPQLVELKASDLPLEVIEDLKRAPAAKIVRYLKQSGKDVAVFHLMVLDKQPGLESLQMILSAQQITGPKGEAAPAGVIAVYVEANQNQLDKVIAELQREDQKQFVALAVQSPVKEEDLKKVVKNQPTEVASQQVPLKDDELKSLGVAPVESKQIEVAVKNRRSNNAGSVLQALKSGPTASTPLKKVLIVLEKVPESLLPKP